MSWPLPASLIPHRPPQLYLTRIIDAEVGGEHPRIVAEGDFLPGDFPGHFPGRTIVPGVVYIEALAQALACLAALSGEGGAHVLTGVEKARFRGICAPPATLRFEVEVTERRFGLTWARGRVRQAEATLCTVVLQAGGMPEEVKQAVLGADGAAPASGP